MKAFRPNAGARSDLFQQHARPEDIANSRVTSSVGFFRHRESQPLRLIARKRLRASREPPWPFPLTLVVVILKISKRTGTCSGTFKGLRTKGVRTILSLLELLHRGGPMRDPRPTAGFPRALVTRAGLGVDLVEFDAMIARQRVMGRAYGVLRISGSGAGMKEPERDASGCLLCHRRSRPA